jgi:hypothetical protein
MQKLPFGFLSWGFEDLGLLDAKNIRVIRKSPEEVVVTGDVSIPESETGEGGFNYSPEITLRRTESGWQACDGIALSFDDIEKTKKEINAINRTD